MITNNYFANLDEAQRTIKSSNQDLKVFQLNVRGISEISKFNVIVSIIQKFQCEFDE